MPRIKEIACRRYSIPLKSALKWGRAHELKRLDHVLIRVELSDGSAGIAEAPPRPMIYGETPASVIDIIDCHLAPLLMGQAVDSWEAAQKLSARMELIKNNNTAKGALDMALHQAVAKHQRRALSEYLEISRPRIQPSYIVSTGPSSEVTADVEAAYHAGLRVFKVKIGKDIQQEADTIQQLRQQFPAARFYVDANQTLAGQNPRAIFQRLLSLDVLYCEEPLPIHRITARRQLRQQSRMPLIADDSALTPHDLERELEFDTFDILNIKTARTGFSQSMRMLSLCARYGKSVMVGSQASSLLGCLHAALFAGRAEVDCASECSFFLKTDVDLGSAPKIIDGWMSLDSVQAALDHLQLALRSLFIDRGPK